MVGISAAYGFFLISGGLVALIYVLILYAILGRNTASGIKDVFFWVMFMAVFLAASIHKFTGYSAYYVLELCLIVAAPLLVIRLVHLVNESSFFRLWFAAFSVFLLLSLLSSVFGRSNELAAAYQFISNLKIVLLLLIGFYITWSPRTETVFWWLIQWLWLPMMLLVAWQWGHPSSYFGLMGHASPASADPLNLFPSRALGAFQHPTYLGLYAGVFTIFCFLNATLGAGRRYIIFGVCYFFLLLASTQRQETVAAIVVIAGIISLLQGKRFIIRNAIIGLFVILLVGGGAWFQFNDNLMNEAERWGLIGHDKIEQPRQLLYYHSVDIANQNAPLGSGLGTFAGAGALKFDISLYLVLHSKCADGYLLGQFPSGDRLGSNALIHVPFIIAYLVPSSAKLEGFPARGAACLVDGICGYEFHIDPFIDFSSLSGSWSLSCSRCFSGCGLQSDG